MTIDVVENASKVESFSCIVGVGGFHMVGACVLRAVPVVGHIHEGGLRVIESEVIRIDEEHVEWGGEHEIGGDGTFHEDARHTWRTNIAQRIVVSFDAFRQVGVHEQVVEGVNMRFGHVAVFFVHCPCTNVVRDNF